MRRFRIMKNRIYILLSFSVGISCYVTASEEESCKYEGFKGFKVVSHLGLFHQDERTSNDKPNFGASRPGEVEGSSIKFVKDCEKPDNDGENKRKKQRAYAEKMLEGYPELLALLRNEGKGTKKIKVN